MKNERIIVNRFQVEEKKRIEYSIKSFEKLINRTTIKIELQLFEVILNLFCKFGNSLDFPCQVPIFLNCSLKVKFVLFIDIKH